MPNKPLYEVKNNAESQLDAGISFSSTTIVLKTGEGFKFPTGINGNATSGGNSTNLNSTGIQAAGVQIGDRIRNITDGSFCRVETVSTNSVTTSLLKGGSGNTWDNSDEWNIGSFFLNLEKRNESGVVTDFELVKIKYTNNAGDTIIIEQRNVEGTQQAFDADDYAVLNQEANTIEAQSDAIMQLDSEGLGRFGDNKGDLVGFSSANTPVKIPKSSVDARFLKSKQSSQGGLEWASLDSFFEESSGGVYNISSGSFVEISLTIGIPGVVDFMYNNTGSILYVLENGTDNIREYALSTPYDISTGSFTQIALSVSAQGVEPRSMLYNNTGSILYILENVQDKINEYALSTPYDISTGSFTQIALNISVGFILQSMLFNNNGSILYLLDEGHDQIEEYALSTPYDISTGSFTQIALGVGKQDTQPKSMLYNNTGSILYVLGNSGPDINEYALKDKDGIYIKNTNQYLGVTRQNPQYPIDLFSGAHVTVGGIWTNSSDENLKENLREVDGVEILKKVNELEIKKWNFKTESKNNHHISPTAQNFYEKFRLGEKKQSISTIDPSGVALVAIQQLTKRIEELESKNKE